MDETYSLYVRSLMERTVSSLAGRGFTALAVQSGKDATDKVLSLIQPGVTVGVAGSVTLREIGVVDAILARGHTVFQQWGTPLAAQPADFDYRRAQLTSDVFLSGSNAVTIDGELVNVDGVGNRVAAMIFGPSKVIVVAGWNKIVPDVSAAVQRIRTVAAPLNARRLSLGVPCVKTGQCVDCDAPDNICRVTTIVSRKPRRTDLTVILVAERLGY
ncbi:MAG: lactate utilization protein [Candidatus Eisenbacteria bacterium]